MSSGFARVLLGSLFCLSCTFPGRAELSEEEDMARRITVAQFPFDRIPQPVRERVEAIVKHPTVYARGPVESFPCRPAVYRWLVDNPHWGFRAWKALGVKCAKAEARGDGTCVALDPTGSEICWRLVIDEPNRRIWYAEGAAKANALAPAIPIRVVLLLRFQEVTGIDGRIGMRHRAEVFAQYEAGKAATWISKIGGLTADGAARKAAEQVGLFFSGLAWYMSEHPTWVKSTLQASATASPEEQQQLAELHRALQGAVDAPDSPILSGAGKPSGRP